MSVAAPELPEWIAINELPLITAWTPEIAAATGWGPPFAEALANEFHRAMLTSILKGGTECEFLGIVERSITGLERPMERAVAGRYFNATLKLARASHRSAQVRRLGITTYVRANVLTDGRELPGSEPLSGIILPFEHPFWRRWLPPLHPDDIRATYIGGTRGQLEREGQTVTSDDDLAWREARLTVRWPVAFEPLLDFRK